MTKTNTDKDLARAINATTKFQALVELCWEWAAQEGLELEGTYHELCHRLHGEQRAAMVLFRDRADELHAQAYRNGPRLGRAQRRD